ncbi:hypothetical protein [Actinoallomurus acanthiterrae]
MLEDERGVGLVLGVVENRVAAWLSLTALARSARGGYMVWNSYRSSAMALVRSVTSAVLWRVDLEVSSSTSQSRALEIGLLNMIALKRVQTLARTTAAAEWEDRAGTSLI